MITISKQLLKSLALSPDEAAVYLAAMELGQATIQVISKKSTVKRTTIYHFLDGLKERGLLQETHKKKRNLYSAVHPQQLIALERVRLKELEDLMPSLLAVYNKSQNKPRVTFYEGVEGIKQVYNDILKTGKSFDGYGDHEFSVKLMGKYFTEYFVPERIRRGIFWRGILRDSKTAREWKKYDNRDLRETRYLPQGDITTEINIYEHKVAMASFRSTPPFAVVIEDPDIARTQHVVWESLWSRL